MYGFNKIDLLII